MVEKKPLFIELYLRREYSTRWNFLEIPIIY